MGSLLGLSRPYWGEEGGAHAWLPMENLPLSDLRRKGIEGCRGDLGP
jgi:hypothetical protein